MTDSSTRHEILVGLHVTDDDVYAAYREHMKPILHRMGGFFRRDFRVAESLGDGNASVNRVFVISFPDRSVMDRFFSDPAYLDAKASFFERSVAHTDIISAYDIEP